jgi:hypothetical protein
MDDIDLFFRRGNGRGFNDADNKKREAVLCILYNPPVEYRVDPRWRDMQLKWRTLLATLCSTPYDDVQVVHRGGRTANYDFDISFLSNGSVIRTVKVEFKHNASKIKAIPQYYSVGENKAYIPTCYADFFYTNYIDMLCQLYPGIVKPDRETYMRFVYSDGYAKHSFFQTLYDADRQGDEAVKKAKGRIVKDSIAAYLRANANQLDMSRLSLDIQSSQTDKVFVLWDLVHFHSDVIRPEEMEIVAVECVKNGNVVVALSKAGTRHNMLLRWKNHLGVLYPAWQISLSR